MRIDTSEGKAWRNDLYERAGRVLEEGTKSGAIDQSCRFVVEMIGDRTTQGALEEALEHPDLMPELAAVLSTSVLEVRYEIEETRELEVLD